MLSVITVVLMPSRTSSHAVSRAPWRNGRVSSAKTATFLPASTARADHAERRAVAGRRQRAGVAVREDRARRPARPPRRARPSRGSSPRPRRGCAAASRSSRVAICSTDSPACGACAKTRFMRSIAQKRFTAVGRVAGHQVADLLELGGELPRARRRAAAHAESDAHGRGDADRRRAADHHRADRLGDLLRRRQRT